MASVAGSVVVAAVLVSLAALMQEPSNSAVLSWLERACPSAVLAYPDEMWYWVGWPPSSMWPDRWAIWQSRR